ncbi:hypothetical protein EYC98_00525 [Halieaceae bacterium IMCC14734]|uniref:SPOR domain-containing protein n=1 Tax=Candidatus Litorirhabdus singularis TaxID=2518993 RepID=A0ABT3TAM3_9GAMM|nr:SPOR domain-containing protein [Candidatus Litorirhabdus singularis]MCX2979343.1 hypothetical protein [Candidatus Litorirhabdus singularis]
MGLNNVLLISELPADFYTLTAALERARPERFQTRTVNTSEQPVDALLDPDNDAIILAFTLETEYLLRLAQKKQLLTPIIVMLDQTAEVQIEKLKQAGAIDYVVRGLINDDMLHRILDYAIALKDARQEQRVLLSEQERLRDAANTARAQVAAAGGSIAPEREQPREAISKSTPAGQQQRVAAAVTRTVAPQAPPLAVAQSASQTPKQRFAGGVGPMLGASAAFVLLTLGIILFNQRLISDDRMSQLEANSKMLVTEFAELKTELAAAERELAVALQNHDDKRIAEPAPIKPATNPLGSDSDLASSIPTKIAAEPPTLLPLESAAMTVISPPVTAVLSNPPSPQPSPDGGATSTVTPAVTTEQSWFINLGSFSNETAALKVAARITDFPWPSQISAISRGERKLYRVRIVNLPSQAAAVEAAAAYRREYGGDAPWIGN